MTKSRLKKIRTIKGIPTKISKGMRKDLDKIITEFKVIGINISYAQASEILRRNK